MKPKIIKMNDENEFQTPERCWILETWNQSEDEKVSISRARVESGMKTQLHSLDGATERYLIVQGVGMVSVGRDRPTEVGPGDVVIIPEGTPQRIENTGKDDLVFYCVCSPRFSPECYVNLE